MLMGKWRRKIAPLMKCLFGIYKMDEGQIIIDGEKTEITVPDDALHKVCNVHQNFSQYGSFHCREYVSGKISVKNIGPLKMVDHKTMNSEAENG